MAETEIQALAERIKSAVRLRVDSFPEEADQRDYVALLSQIRALRALTARLRELDYALVDSTDPHLQNQRERTFMAISTLAQELRQ